MTEQPRASAAELANALSAKLEELARSLLGEPNRRLSNRQTFRYGRKGSLVVEVSGPKRGRWFDHGRGVGGGPLELIARETGGDRRAAADWARKWLGWQVDNSVEPLQRPQDPGATILARALNNRPAPPDDDAQQRTDHAAYLWNMAVPLGATVAAEYLSRDRAIPEPEAIPDDVMRFGRWETGPGPVYTSLLCAVRDEAGVLTAVHGIMLDSRDGSRLERDGEKLPKRTYGPIAGAVRLPGAPEKLILAEGPETALSVWRATGWATRAVLGVGNFIKQMVPPGVEIIIAADADAPNSPAWHSVEEAASRFTELGHIVRIARPAAPPKDGFDWNDVLVRDGLAAVREGIVAANAWSSAPPPPLHFAAPEFTDPNEASAAVRSVVHEFFADATVKAQVRAAYKTRRNTTIEAAGLSTDDDELYDEAEHAGRQHQRARIARRIARDIKFEFGVTRINVPGPRVLLNGSQGLGKTRHALEALAALTEYPGGVLMLVDTLKTALEAEATYRGFADGQSPAVLVFRGMNQPDPAEPSAKMCRRHDLAARVSGLGLSVMKALCGEPTTHKCCPHFAACPYRLQMARARSMAASGGVVIAHHEHGLLPVLGPLFEIVVVDEDLTRRAHEHLDFHPEKIISAEWDQGDAADIADFKMVSRTALVALTGHPGDELTHLRSAGIKAEGLRFAAGHLRTLQEKVALDVGPNAPDATIRAALDLIGASESRKVAALFDQLASEIDLPRRGLIGVTYDPQKGIKVDGAEETQPRVTVHRLRPLMIKDRAAVLITDGTGSAPLNRRIFGERIVERRVAVERQAETTQVSGRIFSRWSLTGARDADRDRAEIVGFLVGLAGANEGPIFVCTYKKVEELLRAELPAELIEGEDAPIWLGHFGAIRGLNAWEHCRTAVIIGRNQPSVTSAESVARAFFGNDDETLLVLEGGRLIGQPRARRMRDGSASIETVEVHSDPRCQLVLEAIREAESVQALDRVRAIFNRRKVFLLSSLVADVAVDRVTSWGDLLGKGHGNAKGDRLAEVMARHGFVPLSGRWLHHLAGDLFGTGKAAKRAVEGLQSYGPENANRYILGNSGPYFLAEFRHSGQRGPYPTKCLFDPVHFPDSDELKAALAGSLGVEIVSLTIRETAEPDLAPAPAPALSEALLLSPVAFGMKTGKGTPIVTDALRLGDRGRVVVYSDGRTAIERCGRRADQAAKPLPTPTLQPAPRRYTVADVRRALGLSGAAMRAEVRSMGCLARGGPELERAAIAAMARLVGPEKFKAAVAGLS